MATVEVPVQAWPLPREGGGCRLQVLWSQANLRSNGAVKFATSVEVGVPGSSQKPAAESGPCWDLGGPAAVAASRSGERTLVVRTQPGGTRGSLLQVWGRRRLLCEVALEASVVSERYFAGFDWDAAERRVCFVAEEPRPDGPALGGVAGAWRGELPHEPDWGELLSGLRSPAIFVLDVDTQTVTQLATPDGAACGHCTWAPSCEEVVYTAWPPESPELPGLRRPGLIYCYNRPSALYASRADGQGAAVRLTPEGLSSAAYPSFAPDGRSLAFLSNSRAVAAGTHNATQELLAMDWHGSSSKCGAAPRTLVSVVERPADADAFPGLYMAWLSPSSWADGGTVVLPTIWRSEEAVVAVDVGSGSVRRLTPAGCSHGLLAVHGDLVATCASSPSSLPQVALGSVSGGAEGNWVRLPPSAAAEGEVAPAVQGALAGLSVEVVACTPEDGSQDDAFEAIVVRPREGSERAPPLLFLHGGPHMAATASWPTCWPLAALAARGWSIVAPNYRGSVGFGERALQSLPGHIGQQDVSDCLAALAEARQRGLCAEPSSAGGVACVGGSHGGFLAGHLAGQRPDIVRAAVLRNPVCNVAAMATVSDIPDWCFKEALGSLERFTLAPRAEELAAMLACSPAAHAEAAAAVPHLLILGAKDLRVPPSQGLVHARLLREKGAASVETYVFPEDSHPLARPRTSLQQWLLTLCFLSR